MRRDFMLEGVVGRRKVSDDGKSIGLDLQFLGGSYYFKLEGDAMRAVPPVGQGVVVKGHLEFKAGTRSFKGEVSGTTEVRLVAVECGPAQSSGRAAA